MNPEASSIPPAAARGGPSGPRRADAKVEPLYPATRLLKGAVIDAQRAAADAKRMLDKARADAAAVRKAAAADADAVRRDAFDRGSERAAAELAQTLRNFGLELERLKGQFARDAQRVAFRAGADDPRRGAGGSPGADRGPGLLGAGPRKLYNRIALHLHPDDVERVRPHQAELTQELAFAREMQLCATRNCPRTACGWRPKWGFTTARSTCS